MQVGYIRNYGGKYAKNGWKCKTLFAKVMAKEKADEEKNKRGAKGT